MKSKFLAVVLVIIMLVPSIIAIVNYSRQQSGAADSLNTVSVTIVDPEENEFVFTRDNGGEEMMNYFLDAISTAIDVEKLPSTIEIGDFYHVTVETSVKKIVYKFYYTSLATDCYFVDSTDGKAYRLDEAMASEFLSGQYAAVLYENGSLPALTVSGEKVLPKDAAWTVIADGNTIVSDTSALVSNDVPDLTIDGGLSMAFSLEPDSCNLKVTDNATKEVIYEGNFDSSTSLPIKSEMSVMIEATASWYKDDNRNYFGEETFIFNAKVGAPAEFYAGVTELEIGEFICVTGINVPNPATISFQSSPDIGYTPVFFADGKNANALIPFNWDLKSGDYVLTFSYGGTTQNINVTLKERDPSHPFRDNLQKTLPQAVIDTYGSEESVKEANDVLTPVAKSRENAEVIRFEGAFAEGVNGLFTAGFGNTYSLSNSNIKFRHTGVDYSATNADVTAVNNGIVVYKGHLSYCGWVVVVEHGLGLKSWYCHLSSADVEVGQEVKKGDKLGVTGNASFIAEPGVHIGLTVFDTPVCQYTLWSDGNNKGIPVYTPQN